jgi:flagellar hook-associated protein 3 FlgL
MGVRITQRLLVDRVLSNLNRQSREILDLQTQLSTGQRVNKPSDDPLATRRAVNARTEVGKNEQFLGNITAVSPQLRDSELAVLSSIDLIQRANELTLQGNNGTNTQPQREAIANEIDEIIEEMLALGNRSSNGRYVFGGTRTLDEPMVATRNVAGDITAVAYVGNSDEIPVEIGEGLTVAANQSGDSVYFSSSAQTVDIYQTLIDTRDALRTGNAAGINTGLAELKTAREQLGVVLSRIGAIQNRLERTGGNLEDINLQLTEVVSDNIDADFAEVTLNLNAQTNAFEAALNAGARVIQPSLLDFVR